MLVLMQLGLTIALSYVVKAIIPGFHKISYLAIAFVIAFSTIILTTFWLLDWFIHHYGFGA